MSHISNLMGRYTPYFSPPAVLLDRFAVDKNLVVARSFVAVAVSVAIFTAAYLAFFAMTGAPPFAAYLLPSALGFLTGGIAALSLLIEKVRADQVIDRQAIHEYTTQKIPSHLATLRLLRPSVQRKVVEGGKNIEIFNKYNTKGAYLLPQVNMIDFMVLVESGADLYQETTQSGCSLLTFFVMEKDPKRLRYLAAQEMLHPNRLTPSQQVKLWLCLGSKEAGQLLQASGFDVNIMDTEKKTPLQRVIEQYLQAGGTQNSTYIHTALAMRDQYPGNFFSDPWDFSDERGPSVFELVGIFWECGANLEKAIHYIQNTNDPTSGGNKKMILDALRDCQSKII